MTSYLSIIYTTDSLILLRTRLIIRSLPETYSLIDK